MQDQSNQGQSQDGSLSRIMSWAAHPFSSNMSVGGWLLFLGLILCGIAAWSRLISHFEE